MSGADDADLQAYYARDRERDRLATGVGAVEFARTIEIVGRSLPPPPSVVADIGGGPGRYTDWLVDAGHRVVHRDLVPHHVEDVRSRHARSVVDAAVGDARSLDLEDESADAVLLLGPLYHLPRSEDRLRALGEARRVVRADGVVHVAAISRWAARLHGMLIERVHLTCPAILAVIDEMEGNGWMRPVVDGGFTGYAHTPEGFRAELRDAGFSVDSLVTVEGVAFALSDLDERLASPTERALLLDTLRAVESVPELLGAGPHLLATCRRASSELS